jgi:hypothetical protein
MIGSFMIPEASLASNELFAMDVSGGPCFFKAAEHDIIHVNSLCTMDHQDRKPIFKIKYREGPIELLSEGMVGAIISLNFWRWAKRAEVDRIRALSGYTDN